MALGGDGIKSLEDFAGCTTDDLIGWTETVDGEQMRHKGVLNAFRLNAAQAEEMIMQSRVKAGWIKAEDLTQNSDDGQAVEPEEGATTPEAGATTQADQPA